MFSFLERGFSFVLVSSILRAMIRAVQIACVVVFALVMIAIHQGFMSLRYFFSGDFPVGFIAGGVFVFGLMLLIQKLEKSSGGVDAATHQQRSGKLIDL